MIEFKEPPRDRWRRPLVEPVGGGKPVAMTRPSTLAKGVDDLTALMGWKVRTALQGLAISEDLIAEGSTTDAGEKRAWDKIAERALERVASSKGASHGTARHKATELADQGESITHLPKSIREDVRAYQDALVRARMEPVMQEIFCVNDAIGAAGTFDRLLKGPGGGYAIGDIKTHEKKGYDVAAFSGLAWAIQIAIYANSVPYCAERGRLSWEECGVTAPSLEKGVVMEMVLDQSECHVHLIDLAAGWDYAQLAVKVREARKAGRSLVKEIKG